MNSTSERRADMISGEDFEVDELREVVFGGSGRMDRVLALSLLGRKSYPEKMRDLERILAEEQEPPRLRHTAAVALGHAGTSEALERLAAHLDVQHPVVLRGILEALRRLGGRQALDAIEAQLKEDWGGVPARWAATLLAFQLGTAGFDVEVPDPKGLVEADPKQAHPIEVASAEAEVVERSLSDLKTKAPALELTGEGALTLVCGDQQLLWLFNRAFAQPEGARLLMKRKAVVGVVAAHYTLEGDAWEIRYYALAQPAEGRRSTDILVMTTSGITAFAGHAEVREEAASFALQAVQRPGAVPVDIQGIYEKGQVRFERAVSHLRRLEPARPTPRTGRA